MTCRAILIAATFLLATAQLTVQGQTRDEKVRTDRQQLADDDRWIYNDLERGFAAAKQSNKPLLIVFR